MYLLFVIGLFLSSCGSVVVTSRPNHPPPIWFYPNRLEVVRYVYFPEHSIYYDLTLSNYLYLKINVSLRAKILPHSYNTINLNRIRYVRIKDFRGDNIKQYHNENNIRRSDKTNKSNTKSASTIKTRRN